MQYITVNPHGCLYLYHCLILKKPVLKHVLQFYGNKITKSEDFSLNLVVWILDSYIE